MKRLTLAIGLIALMLSAAPAFAQSRGGSHSGGGSHFRGGSHFGGGSHFRGGRSRVRIGVGFGYWYDPFWYDPWYRPVYGYPYGYYGRNGYGGYGDGGYGYGADWAVVDTDVSPESARVYLDGQYIGTADDFDGYPDYLYLRRGHYRVEFRLPGFETRTIDVAARPGTKIDIDDKLAKIPGAPQYGSYEEQEPAGGVRRFWGKRGDATAAVTGDDDYGPGPRRYREGPRDRDDDRYDEDRDRDRRDDDDVEDQYERAPADARPAPRDGWRDRSDARIQPGDTWIRLNVQPTDAAIYLDDRFIGTASELDAENGIAVPPGRHALVVSRPGYRDKRVEVNVSRGQTEKVDVKLER
jgi:PEGA domain